MKTKNSLSELYSFPGFRASNRLKGILGDPQARIVTLRRRQKKLFVPVVVEGGQGITTARRIWYETYLVEAPVFTLSLNIGVSTVRVAAG